MMINQIGWPILQCRLFLFANAIIAQIKGLIKANEIYLQKKGLSLFCILDWSITSIELRRIHSKEKNLNTF